MLAVDIVEEAGFQPIEASDADEAVAILNARPDIRIIFSDIQMPGSMDGNKLAATVRDRWPSIKIVLTSGHCRQEDLELQPGNLFFAKPYKPGELAAALQRLAN